MDNFSISAAPRVYSYTRFSTPEQAQGDSSRRQAEAAQKWARDRGLVLDDRLKLEDLGVSAYRGTNVEGDKGLAGFLTACRSGLIPVGSYLLVESLDRISRMQPRRVQSLINEIVDAGVTICSLNDGQEYDAARLDNDPTALLISLMVAWRAHEESKVKGRRVAAAWSEKRRKVSTGEVTHYTRRCPSWLEWTGDGWGFKQPQTDAVRRIFALTLSGLGEHKIAQVLNGDKTPVLERGKHWHRSTVAKVLRNPATVGTLTPGRMDYERKASRRVAEEPVPGFYPPAVSQGDWLAVRAIKSGRRGTRGRGATSPIKSLFAGLLLCGDCGASVTRVFKGKRSLPKFVCTRAKVGAASHTYQSVHQAELEEAFLENWQGLLQDVPAGDDAVGVDSEAANLEAVILAETDKLEGLVRLFEAKPSNVLASQIAGAEAQLRVLQEQLASLNRHRAQVDHGIIWSRIDGLCQALAGGADGLDVLRVNAALRMLFAGITVDSKGGRLIFHWRQGGDRSIVFRWPIGAS